MKLQEGSSDEVMNYRGLSLYLKMSQGTLRRKVMRGAIPYFKIGGSVRFSKKHIDLWLEEYQKGQVTMNKEQRTKKEEGASSVEQGKLNHC